MNSTIYYTPSDLIILLGIAMVFAMIAMTMIANTRRDGHVKENLELKDVQIARLTTELETLNEACQAMQKEVNLKDLYEGESDRYLQAINAAKSGFTQHQLMEQYDLIEAEAELIISIHGDETRVDEI